MNYKYALACLCGILLAVGITIWARPDPKTPVTTLESGAIVGTVGYTGTLQIDDEGYLRIEQRDHVFDVGTVDASSVLAYRQLNTLNDGTRLDLDVLREHAGRAVTVIAVVEYTRHATEVFRPVRVVQMEIFLHKTGLPKVVTE